MKAMMFVLLMSVLLAGCFSSSVRYYALQDGQASALLSNTHPPAHRVGVSVVTLPKLLNRPQLVVRLSDSELKFEEQHQWGGRLQEEISQLLATELQALHPQDGVYLYPADNRTMPNQQWSADILQLDGMLGGGVTLQANCRLLDKSNRLPVFERTVQRRLQTEGAQINDYISAQRALLKQLAAACSW
jgi:uncharacterized lipoprotein YmbA